LFAAVVRGGARPGPAPSRHPDDPAAALLKRLVEAHAISPELVKKLLLELINAPTSATLSTLVGAPVSRLSMACPQAAGIRITINTDWILPP
jgi:hypothetical protein